MARYAKHYEIEGGGDRVMVKVPGKPVYLRASRIVLTNPCSYCGAIAGEPCRDGKRHTAATHWQRRVVPTVCVDCGARLTALGNLRRCNRCYATYQQARAAASLTIVNALRVGAITRPDGCEACGGQSVGGRALDGHHHLGYEPEHQLSVQWLCRRCHRRAHATNDQEASR